MVNILKLSAQVVTVVGFFYTPAVAATNDCKFEGLCGIINEAMSSAISVDDYNLHGLNKIYSSFGSELTTQTDFNVNSISIPSAGANGGDSFSFSEFLTGLAEFFGSRENVSLEPQPDNGVDGIRLLNDAGARTEEYTVYLGYLERFNQVKSNVDGAKTQSARQFLADELRAVEAEWIAIGFKYQIEELLRQRDEVRLQDPAEIAAQITQLRDVSKGFSISTSISTQLSSDAWNRLAVTFTEEDRPEVSTETGTFALAGLSFEVTEFPTVGPTLLPDNIVQFLRRFFESNDCAAQDAPCKKIEGWLGISTITDRVILLRNVRLWLHDEVGHEDVAQVDGINFASELYLEMAGPFLYMTRKGQLVP